MLISSTNGAPLLVDANGSSTGTDAADAETDAGDDTGIEFIGLLDGAETIDAVVGLYIPGTFFVFGKVMPGCVRGNEDIVRRGG